MSVFAFEVILQLRWLNQILTPVCETSLSKSVIGSWAENRHLDHDLTNNCPKSFCSAIAKIRSIVIATIQFCDYSVEDRRAEINSQWHRSTELYLSLPKAGFLLSHHKVFWGNKIYTIKPSFCAKNFILSPCWWLLIRFDLMKGIRS